MTIIQSPRQRANTIDALENMWPSVPEANVVPDLSVWRADDKGTQPTCGTIACFGGWCAWWPNFILQGVKAEHNGYPHVTQPGRPSPMLASYFLFGYNNMFNSRGAHPADTTFAGTDHALVTNRLKWLLANSVVDETLEGITI